MDDSAPVRSQRAGPAPGDDWDVVDVGHRRPRWQQRWAASSGLVHLLLIVAALAAVIAAIVGAAASGASPARRTVTVITSPTGAPATVDANGCPVGVRCGQGRVPSALLRAVHSAYPGAHVQFFAATVDASSHRVYRAVVVAVRVPVYSVVVHLQCVPGGPALRRSVHRAASTYDKLDGDQGIISRFLAVVVPGAAPGCSTSIELQTVSRSPALDAQVLRLAADPGVLAS